MFPSNPSCHLAGPHPKLKLALSLNSAAPPTGNPRAPKPLWREDVYVCVCVGGGSGGVCHMTHQPDTSQACRPIRGLGGSGAGLSHSRCALLLSSGSTWSGSGAATASTRWPAQDRRCTWQPAPWWSAPPTAPSPARAARRRWLAACRGRPSCRAVA